jgi:membrane fusion protein
LKYTFFRPEAADAATAESSAASVPVAPISWQMLGGTLVLATAAIVLFITTAEYARKETAPGALVATGGTIRVSAGREGVVSGLIVKEGDHVEAGQGLFTIGAQNGLEGGGSLYASLIQSIDAQIKLLKGQIEADPARVANEIVRLDASIESVKAQREAIVAQRGHPVSALRKGKRDEGCPAGAGRHSACQPTELGRTRPHVGLHRP